MYDTCFEKKNKNKIVRTHAKRGGVLSPSRYAITATVAQNSLAP